MTHKSINNNKRKWNRKQCVNRTQEAAKSCTNRCHRYKTVEKI